MKPKLKDLILQREEEMMNYGYSYDRTKNYKCCWNKFYNYLKERNIDYYDSGLYDQFLKDVYNYTKGTITNQKQSIALKAKAFLEDFDNCKDNAKSYAIKYEIIKLNDYYENLLINYLKECQCNYNSDSTINRKNKYTRVFFKYLQDNNISNVIEIKKDLIVNYINNISKDYCKRRCSFWILKCILKYLYNENLIKEDFTYLVPKIKYTANKTVPSYFTKEEIDKIIKYFEDKNTNEIGKRNYAMILLMISYGLRISDIRNLKFENIKWDTNKIIITQTKTKNTLTLPLLEDVGNSIIDYIKNGRPNSKEKYIFLRSKPPYVKLSHQTNLYADFKKSLMLSNINTTNRKGVHSLRHSLATRMLENETPLNIISSTLGHSNTAVTKVYLKVDNNQLKECFVRLSNEECF